MTPFPQAAGPIGVFDSGYGGLTILHGIRQLLPHHDFIYLGDNARAPYGPRSFEVVYEFTRQAVRHLFAEGCHLVILGCNTASAKALRSIQQNDLPQWDAHRRVLGIIRPTAEIVGGLTRSRHVGILATEGTIRSHSYAMEIAKLHPDIKVTGVACPFWVPLVEYNEADSPGADYFVKKYLDQLLHADSAIDTIILGCTHYPILLPKILKYTPAGSVSVYLEEPAVLCVRDTGIGIAPEDLPRVFERSYTGLTGRADRRASGLGLSLCRQVCDRLGHGLSIESVPDQGTTVRVDLASRKLDME